MKFKLDDINNKHPFQVPDEYFDELTSKIQSRISTDSTRQTTPYYKLAWALPAMVIIISAGLWVVNLRTSNEPENLLAEVSDEAIMQYLESDDLSIAELIDMTDRPEELVDDPDYLQGIELEGESLDELMNTFDLNETYL